MNERSTRGTGRRVGRERVLAAAVDLLAGADLADLLSFLGTRAVAEAADVQPATVHHHFANRDDNPKSNARLAVAVLEAALDQGAEQRSPMRPLRDVDDSGDVDELAIWRSAMAYRMRELLDDHVGATAKLAAAAAARNDAAPRAALRERYDRNIAAYGTSFDELATRFGRRFDTDSGVTAEMMATVVGALADGLVLRHQFAPDAVDLEVFSETVVRMFEAMTTPVGATVSVSDAVAERLLSRRDTLALPADSGMNQSKRNEIADAANRLYGRAGAAALTVTAVARESGVSRSTVIANFADRNGLAASVWSHFIPELERELTADRARGIPAAHVLERHLLRVVERTREHADLSALLLEGILATTARRGAPDYLAPDDPRTVVPLPLLIVPVLLDESMRLRAGDDGASAAAHDLAATLTSLTMLRAISRPAESTSATVHHLLDMILEGILRRPEA